MVKPCLRCRDLLSRLATRLLPPEIVRVASSSQKLLRSSYHIISAPPPPGEVTTLDFALFSLAVPQAPSVHRGLFALAEQNHTSCPSAATASAAAAAPHRLPGTRNPEPNTLKTLTKIFQLYATLSPQTLLGTIYVEKRCSKSTAKFSTCVVGGVLSSSSWVRIRRSKTSKQLEQNRSQLEVVHVTRNAA